MTEASKKISQPNIYIIYKWPLPQVGRKKVSCRYYAFANTYLNDCVNNKSKHVEGSVQTGPNNKVVDDGLIATMCWM